MQDLGEAEFVSFHRAIDEIVGGCGFDLDIETVSAQEYVGGGETDSLVAVEETVVLAKRLHQCGRLFSERIVTAGLRAKGGGLNRALVANTVHTSEHVNEPVLHLVDFRDCQ